MVARVTKICNVCDFLLLGMQRYVPMTPLEVDKLMASGLDGAKAVLTIAPAKLTAAPRKSQKKLNQAKAAQVKGAAAKDGGASMVVVFRLQGLDGEATEPIVETVDEEGGEEVDPEAEFAIAATVGEAGGLELLVDILQRSTPLLRARECSAMLLKLLQHCCKIATNRRRVLAAGTYRHAWQPGDLVPFGGERLVAHDEEPTPLRVHRRDELVDLFVARREQVEAERLDAERRTLNPSDGVRRLGVALVCRRRVGLGGKGDGA